MKKIITLILCLTIITGMFVLPASAVSQNAQITIKTATVSPVIDGIVSDGEYGKKIHSVDYNNDEFISSFDTDKNITADFYMAWEEENIYMAWVVNAEEHYPIPTDTDYDGDGIFTTNDLAHMWEFSCVQFMLCSGAPDISNPVYQCNSYGNYLEGGLSVMDDCSSRKVMWCRPVDAYNITTNDWEFAGARDEEAKTTTYEVRIPFQALGIYDADADTKLGLTYAVSDQKDFYDNPSMCEWQDGILDGKNMDAGAVVILSEETTDGNITGKPLANPEYNIEVSAPEHYIPGKTVDVTLTLKDIAEESGYGMVHLLLYYDADKVEPVIKNNITDSEDDNKEMEKFLVTSPCSEEWEGICKLEEENSRYDLSFLTTKNSSHAKSDGSVVIKVPFKVKADTQEEIAFQVPHAKTYCADYSLQKHFGNAGRVLLTKDPNPEPDHIIPKENSGLTIDTEKGFLNGIDDKTTVKNLRSMFENSVKVLKEDGTVAEDDEKIGTGYKIKNDIEEITVILLGDGNGDGKISSKDYLLAKRTFLGTYNPSSDAMLAALCIEGGSKPTSKDYLKIKRHFLGTYNIYKQ